MAIRAGRRDFDSENHRNIVVIHSTTRQERKKGGQSSYKLFEMQEVIMSGFFSSLRDCREPK